MARKMGANIVSNYQDYCLVITNKVTKEMAGKVKNMTGVKVLKPEYIKDCLNYNAKLNERDYYHRFSG